MNAKRYETIARTPYFEYCYSAAPEKADGPKGTGEKTLIVSFPGRKNNRPADISPDQSPTFLWKDLNSSDADVLFIRSVYEGDHNYANIHDDYDLLPGLLYNLRKQKGIDRLVLFGFSLGCGPCLWLARKNIADEVVLLSPGLYSVVTLNAVEDSRWQQDFDKFCATWSLPEIEPYPQDVPVKIIQGLNLEDDLLKERPLVYYLKLLMPQATVERVPGVGHHIPNFWKDQGILQTKIHDVLDIKTTNRVRDHKANWTRLAGASTRGAHPIVEQSLAAYG
jgi:hypothetical protein